MTFAKLYLEYCRALDGGGPTLIELVVAARNEGATISYVPPAFTVNPALLVRVHIKGVVYVIGSIPPDDVEAHNVALSQGG